MLKNAHPLIKLIFKLIIFISIFPVHSAIKLGSFIGAWDALYEYKLGDVVIYNNATYLSIKAVNKNRVPSAKLSHWQILGVDTAGSKGATGAQGIQGPMGPQGYQGVQGSVGPAGAKGAQGPIGLTGLNGTTGAKGDTGAQGLKGDMGLTGLQGPKGDTGIMGLQGPIGLTGLNGKAGATGPKGIQGPVGPSGAKGETGLTGARGPAGLPQAGNNLGDMQYWDGSQWQIVQVGTNNTTLKVCNGVPKWVQVNCSFQIGDKGPAGGIVFYLSDNTGLHGLEAAPADIIDSKGNSDFAWGCYTNWTLVFGAKATAVGTGAANTAAIVSACNELNTAAKMADNYTFNGYSDWFLPSQDELNLLYGKKSIVGGFVNFSYWSSSEQGDQGNAWAQGFDTSGQWSGQYGNGKDNAYLVRAIRSF